MARGMRRSRSCLQNRPSSQKRERLLDPCSFWLVKCDLCTGAFRKRVFEARFETRRNTARANSRPRTRPRWGEEQTSNSEVCKFMSERDEIHFRENRPSLSRFKTKLMTEFALRKMIRWRKSTRRSESLWKRRRKKGGKNWRSRRNRKKKKIEEVLAPQEAQV